MNLVDPDVSEDDIEAEAMAAMRDARGNVSDTVPHAETPPKRRRTVA